MASGDILCRFTAASGRAVGSDSAILESLTGGSTPSERFVRWSFDDTTTNYVDFRDVLPANYAGGGITVKIGHGAAAATGNVIYGGAFRRVQDDAEDLDTAHTYSYQDTAASAVPTVIGEVNYDEFAMTNGAQMDSLAAGEMFVLRLRRNASSGSDTLTGDGYVYTVEIRET